MSQPARGGEHKKVLADALRELRRARGRLEAIERARREPIAIVGAGMRLPGDVNDPDGLWRLLRDGGDAATPLVNSPDGRRPPVEERDADGAFAGLMSQVDSFDAEFFGIIPIEAAHMDPQQRLVLEVAWEAMEDANVPLEQLQRGTTGVFLGVYGTDYLTLQIGDPSLVNAYTAPGGALSITANRLSYFLDVDGPSIAIDTACSSSLVSLHLACRALRNGDCDRALVGGVNAILSPLSTLVTEKVLPIAQSGRCRAFDAAADGMIRAEGCAMLLLERESDARAAGRRIRGRVRGTAVNHDGRTNGLTAPNPRSHVTVLERAVEDAGVDPADVVYVEAHGTGTPLGDPIEIAALREVYGRGEAACAVGSVKTNFGHLEAAAGVAGLLKAMLVLEHGEVPPHLHLRELNPEIDLEGTRIHVPSDPAPLAGDPDRRLAAVSAFGFGGANAHAVLEGPPPSPAESAAERSAPKLVLPLSARSDGALKELAHQYAHRLRDLDEGEAAKVCAAAATGRTHHQRRRCVSADDLAGLVRELEATASGPARHAGAGDPLIAFVFSGQGSQWAGMGRELIEREPAARAELEACAEVVKELAGWSLFDQLRAPRGESRIHETEVAQLSIGALQLALAALLREWGVVPDAVTGHSMGEVVAACVAGALDREAALELLLHRARIAERGARGGAMANVALPADEVQELLSDVPGRIAIAAVNSPGATVVSGDPAAVDTLVNAASNTGAKCKRLRVEYGFHSPLLDGRDDELASAVGHLGTRAADAAFYSTVTGDRVEVAQLDGGHWGRNLREPVRFGQAAAALARDGVTIFVEVGPHPVLLRDLLTTLDASPARAIAVGSLQREQSLAASLDRSLAALYEEGLAIEWSRVLEPPASHVALPLYPWQRQRHWLPAVADPTLQNGGGAVDTGEATEGPGPAPTDGDANRPPRDIEGLARYIREHLVIATGIDDIEAISDDQPLDTLGLDSLTAVQIKNQIERELSIEIPLKMLLEGGTPLDFARAVAKGLEQVEGESEEREAELQSVQGER